MKPIVYIYNFKTKQYVSKNDISKFSVEVKRNDISTATIEIIDSHLIDLSLNTPFVFGLNLKLDTQLIFAGISQEIRIGKNNKLSIKCYDISGYLNRLFLDKKLSESESLKTLIISFLRYINDISGVKIYLNHVLNDKLFDIFTYDITNDSIYKILQTLSKEEYFNFDIIWDIRDRHNEFDNDYILNIQRANKEDGDNLLINYINPITEDITITFDDINTDILYYSKLNNVIYIKHKNTKYKNILPTFIKKQEIPYISYKNTLNNIHKQNIQNNLIQYKEFNYKLNIQNTQLIEKLQLGRYYAIPFKLRNKVFQQNMRLEQAVYTFDKKFDVNLKFGYE